MEKRRATIYLDADLYRALKLKAADRDRTVSDIVAEAVRRDLAEDAVDLLAFEERATEPNLSFSEVVKQLRRDGRV
jgi:predicted CopG family antitoxin